MASEKILKKKKKIVADLAAELKEAQSLVLADYMGLNVAQDTEMRRAMREEGVVYKVVKNTISSRALEKLEITGMDDILKGPTALAYSTEDIVLAPRLVKKFQDQFKKVIEIKGGIVEGKQVPIDTIMALASIPPQQELYGMLVSSMMFPLTSLAITLNLVAEKGAEAGATDVASLVVSADSDEQSAEQEAAKEEAKSEDEAAGTTNTETKEEESADKQE